MEERLKVRGFKTQLFLTHSVILVLCSVCELHHHHSDTVSFGPDVEVLFTGTASMMPSKYRNVSGILLRVS